MVKDIDSHVVQALREIYEDEAFTQGFFGVVAGRKNDVAETTIDRIGQIGSMDRKDAIRFCRLLEEAGCGTLLVGRKGWKTRFQWEYSLPSIGRAAKGEIDTLEKVDPDVAADAADQHDADASSGQSVTKTNGPLTIIEAKQRLAEALGLTPDRIEITIRG